MKFVHKTKDVYNFCLESRIFKFNQSEFESDEELVIESLKRTKDYKYWLIEEKWVKEEEKEEEEIIEEEEKEEVETEIIVDTSIWDITYDKLSTKDLQDRYEELYGKKVWNPYKNNRIFLIKKIEEIIKKD